MILFSDLFKYFFSPAVKPYRLSELHPKRTPIARGEGVPKFIFSKYNNRYIPSSGRITFSDFKEVLCQTGSLVVTFSGKGSDVGQFPPERINTDHPSINIENYEVKSDIVFNSEKILELYGKYEEDDVTSDIVLKTSFVNVLIPDVCILLFCSNDIKTNTALGLVDNIGAKVGLRSSNTMDSITIVLLETLSFYT